MTDRQLLEDAARAAGITPDTSKANGGPSDNDGFDIAGNLVLDWHNGVTWNPLEDSGQALELAVKLGLEIIPIEGGGVDIQRTTEADPFGVLLATESYGTDPMAATRRAIVRAAAALAPKE